MRKIRISRLAVVVAALVATACAEGALRSPAGPSPLTALPESTAAADWAANTGWMTAVDGQMVAGTEVVGAISGACPNREMTVRGVRTAVNAGTMFGPGVSCATLAAGTRIHITGLLTTSNGTYTLIATAISVSESGAGEPGGPDRRHNHVSGEGTISYVSGQCPTATMAISGYNVVTTAATTYVGGTCESLRPGARVAVSGVNQGTAVVAETVEFKN